MQPALEPEEEDPQEEIPKKKGKKSPCIWKDDDGSHVPTSILIQVVGAMKRNGQWNSMETREVKWVTISSKINKILK